jgi:hypothetical protein
MRRLPDLNPCDSPSIEPVRPIARPRYSLRNQGILSVERFRKRIVCRMRANGLGNNHQMRLDRRKYSPPAALASGLLEDRASREDRRNSWAAAATQASDCPSHSAPPIRYQEIDTPQIRGERRGDRLATPFRSPACGETAACWIGAGMKKCSSLSARSKIVITSCMSVAAEHDRRRCAHEKYRGDDQRFPSARDELIRAAYERSK